jgi:hypothetical protein
MSNEQVFIINEQIVGAEPPPAGAPLDTGTPPAAAMPGVSNEPVMTGEQLYAMAFAAYAARADDDGWDMLCPDRALSTVEDRRVTLRNRRGVLVVYAWIGQQLVEV